MVQIMPFFKLVFEMFCFYFYWFVQYLRYI